MGSSCSVPIKAEITNVIWIESEIDKDEIVQYTKDLEKNKSLNLKLFGDIDESINYLKKLQFQETKIIVSGSLYTEFVNSFKENIAEMYIAPKIIVFTSDIDNFIKTNKEYNSYKYRFYKYGEVVNTFKKIKQFLKNDKDNMVEIENKPKKNKAVGKVQLSIEYVDSIEKLILPMFFKTLLNDTSKDLVRKNTNTLYNTYTFENDEIQSLLYSIEPMKDMPIEILLKYYI